MNKIKDETLPLVVSDCGFQIEYDVLRRTFGPDSVHVIQLERNGCTFEDDSREYVHMKDQPTPRIANNANVHSYAMLLKTFVKNLGWGPKADG